MPAPRVFPVRPGPARALIVCALLTCAAGAALGAEQPVPAPSLGFGYCPPPQRPSCFDSEDTYTRQTALDACAAAFQRYTQSVANYRNCLSREIARAASQASSDSSGFKCRSTGLRSCK
jgi:hypothetical protein